MQQNRYVDIIGYDTYDKINHAYAFGGVAMTINTIQAYLDIP
ncbi:LCP family glycopolymer transferase, partial [Escherichia coli]